METIEISIIYTKYITSWWDFNIYLKRVFINSINLRLWRFTLRFSWSKLKDTGGDNSEEKKKENIKTLETYLFGQTKIK